MNECVTVAQNVQLANHVWRNSGHGQEGSK